MRHGTLECDHCGGPVSFRAPFCAYCRAKLTWDAQVVLERGAAILDFDLRHVPLPTEKPGGASFFPRRPEGTLVESGPAALLNANLPPRLRDACLVIRGTCLDVHGSISLIARTHKSQTAKVCYELVFYPAYRSYRLSRVVWLGPGIGAEIIRDFTYAEPIAGVGKSNELELRVADSLFQVHVNGTLVTSIVEEAFGFGQFGWATSSQSRSHPSSILLERLSLFRVA